MPKLLDNFGFNYPLRALVASAYLGGNGEREAVYPVRYTDSTGAALSGANKYVMRLAKEPPVGAFWSVTIYNAGDKMLIENPINRYKVGTDTKDDPADVAKDGFDAMMRGDAEIVSGWKNKVQTTVANVTPNEMLAEQHRKMAEPGTGKK